ncbi:o-succinylbenzoate--CoA ligase [Gordonia sp. CPCC 205333]|uniref:o-succinylbenzoate--CoA ligase n=1 Tax=Gordonia sp. CPCC 205333 TaxID=3140790 RepID=UPI003AF3331C
MPMGPAVLDVADDLTALLDGDAAYLPLPPAPDDPAAILLTDALGAGQPIADDAALVIATSGTTGIPKGAVHTAATLRASARATASRLGGDGNWLLALPAHHIAGFQVLLRALAAGHKPAVLDVSHGFDVNEFVVMAAALRAARRYTSLVPTQLLKVLQSPSATKTLSEFDAVLVGGAATPAPLRRRAEQSGVPIVATYGMSETAGGCVYDGKPLDGVRVRITESGRVALGGPTVAHGYRNHPDHPSFAEPGWFLTDDLGRIDDGVLSIIGRADEAICTGGLTVVPQAVEAVLLEDPLVAQCAVVGVRDGRLGQRVVAVVVAAGDVEPTLDSLAGRVGEQLDRFAAPRELFVVDALPMRGPGKVDRRALRTQLEG